MSQPFSSAWNNLSSEPIDQSSKMPWGIKDNSTNSILQSNGGIAESPQLSFTNSPLTPQLTSTTTNTSIVTNGNVNGVYQQQLQQQQPSSTNYTEKKQYSMNEMFDVYQSMATRNQFVASYQNDDKIRSAEINTPLHIDLLESRKNMATPANNDLSLDMNNLNVNDNNVNDQNDLDSSWANASNPIVGSAHFQEEDLTSAIPSSSPGAQKNVANTSSNILGSANTPLMSTNSNLPPVQNIPLLNHSTSSFLQQHHHQQQQQQISRPSTPLINSIPDLKQNLNLPPGITPKLSPSEIKWYYLDPSGNTQGPFSGDMMQDWFSSNFFTLDLQIRRVGETSYRTLAEFIQQIGDYQTPFSHPLPAVNAYTQGVSTPVLTGVVGGPPSFNQPFGSSSMFFNNNPGFQNGLQSSFFGSNNPMNTSFDMQSQFQQPNHQINQQNWINANNTNNDFLQNQLYNTSSPFLQATSLTGLQSFGQQTQQQSNTTSVGNDTIGSATSIHDTPLKSPTPLSNNYTSISKDLNIDDNSLVLDGIHSKVVSDILEDDSFVPSSQQQQQQPQPQQQQQQPVKEESSPAVIAPLPSSTPVKETVKVAEKPREPVEEVKKAPAANTVKPESVNNKPASSRQTSSTPTLVVEEEKSEKKPVAKKPSLAPWASVTSVKPAMTLDEIQKIENEKRKKALEEQAKKQEKIVASLSASDLDLNIFPDLRSSQLNESQRKALPPTSNWATVGTNHQAPVKTLEEIQKEEQEAAAIAAAKLKAEREAALADAQFNALISGSANKTSFAAALSNPAVSASPAVDSAWTLVSNSKKLGSGKPVLTSSKSIIKNANVTPAVNPSLLRSISASGVPAITRSDSTTSVSSNNGGAYSGSSPSSFPTSEASNPAREVISWARTQLLGLNQSVNKEDVLSIMLQLPNGSEYSEIIADTIYSNSSTMDGRRFAQEFIKRRKNVEDIVEKHGVSSFSWSDTLMNTGNNSSDDWDLAFTKVVSKKNKKRN